MHNRIVVTLDGADWKGSILQPLVLFFLSQNSQVMITELLSAGMA
jgi:hypothetical protein